MRKILSLLAIVFMSFSAIAEHHGDENADLHAAIKAFDHAYANNDVEKYFSFYADDATAYFGDGRVDIAAYHEMWIGLMAAGGGVELTCGKRSMVNGRSSACTTAEFQRKSDTPLDEPLDAVGFNGVTGNYVQRRRWRSCASGNLRRTIMTKVKQVAALKTKVDSDAHDQKLGMNKPIERRDFLQGAAISLAAAAVGGVMPELAFGAGLSAEKAAQDQPGYYPPTRTGMRGSHPGSFEGAHAVRDNPGILTEAQDTDEHYDLIVVGGGISGLAAAHFYRKEAGPDAKILILENHDDFGGHAKRNEFHVDGKLLLMNGGTVLISSPTPYSPVADGLLKHLGIYPEKLAKDTNNKDLHAKYSLGAGVFFDKETFGEDKFVLQAGGYKKSAKDTAKFLAQAPLSDAVRKDILAIETGSVDYMPGLTADEKKDRLSRMSYAAGCRQSQSGCDALLFTCNGRVLGLRNRCHFGP